MNFGPDFYTHPDQKGAVRGDLSLQGVILSRIDENTTRYTLYSKSDPKVMGVPQYIIKKKAKASGTMPRAFKDKIDEFEKKRKKNN